MSSYLLYYLPIILDKVNVNKLNKGSRSKLDVKLHVLKLPVIPTVPEAAGSSGAAESIKYSKGRPEGPSRGGQRDNLVFTLLSTKCPQIVVHDHISSQLWRFTTLDEFGHKNRKYLVFSECPVLSWSLLLALVVAGVGRVVRGVIVCELGPGET